MLRHSPPRLAGAVPAENSAESDQVLFNRIRRRYVARPWSLRALTGTRLQGWAAVAGVVMGAAFFLGPWMWDEWQELLHKKFVPLDPSTMPRMSPDWWENEWRKMNVTWRVGESMPSFYEKPYAFVKKTTGRDLSTAELFAATRPDGEGGGKRSGRWRRASSLFKRDGGAESAFAGNPRKVRALVPLCGDSPIVRTMAIQGYDVDAVDSSQTAIQSAVEKTERALPLDAYDRIHFHWKDFFAPELWEADLKGRQYDVIYERQGMTSLNREQRPDYAFLLKRALKTDGVLYVEGIFRTGRVKGNKVRGPPYSLSKKELDHLFPQHEGFFVRCEEKNDAMAMLSRENRVLQKVPKELYITPFHCAVFRAAAVNLAEREKAQAAEAATSAPLVTTH